MVCVVCERDITLGDERYANEWERTRRRFPCCSEACSAGFNPDEHWMPGDEPSAAAPEEELRLVRVARNRLRDGDGPELVAHDLLVAGVAPQVLRTLLDGALLGAAQSQKENREGFWTLLLLGIGVFKRDRRDTRLIERAYAAIEQWRLRSKRWKLNRELGASVRLR